MEIPMSRAVWIPALLLSMFWIKANSVAAEPRKWQEWKVQEVIRTFLVDVDADLRQSSNNLERWETTCNNITKQLDESKVPRNDKLRKTMEDSIRNMKKIVEDF